LPITTNCKAWLAIALESGGKRKKWLQQGAAEPTMPGTGVLRFRNLPK
jgi:hypothetical protein